MSLDVDPPRHPELSEVVDPAEYEDTEPGGEEYHREDLETALADGAWTRAFNEWADHTDVSEAEFEIMRELELFDRFDFFWDAFADRVGYHTPGIPEDWRERELHPALDSWTTVSTINAGLAELGDTVAELLGTEYVDWDEEYEEPDDLPEY